MPSLLAGFTVEVEPPVMPSVEMPPSSVVATVVPVRGLPGEAGTPDTSAVLEALEPPVALDVLYQNSLI